MKSEVIHIFAKISIILKLSTGTPVNKKSLCNLKLFRI